MLTTRGSEQNDIKNHIVYNKTVPKTETVFYTKIKIQQPKEKISNSFTNVKKKLFLLSSFLEYKSKIFDYRQFSRPPPFCNELRV